MIIAFVIMTPGRVAAVRFIEWEAYRRSPRMSGRCRREAAG
jgi:hypothetical protein